MGEGKKWSDLSQRSRRLLIAGAAAETILKAVAMVDLVRRPASEIRGPKWAWIPAVTVINSFGCAPLAYLIFARRPGSRNGTSDPQAVRN